MKKLDVCIYAGYNRIIKSPKDTLYKWLFIAIIFYKDHLVLSTIKNKT